jgi:hypothetical protein
LWSRCRHPKEKIFVGRQRSATQRDRRRPENANSESFVSTRLGQRSSPTGRRPSTARLPPSRIPKEGAVGPTCVAVLVVGGRPNPQGARPRPFVPSRTRAPSSDSVRGAGEV